MGATRERAQPRRQAGGAETGLMTRLPAEARDGLMRAWLEILREKHPEVSWVAVTQEPEDDQPDEGLSFPELPINGHEGLFS
jgi:hypothetical protein